MFDIGFLQSPRKQKKRFLKTENIIDVKKCKEIENILATIRDNTARIKTNTNFWLEFVKTFPRLISKIVILRFLGTGSLLVAILISAKILNESNSLTAGFFFIAAYGLFQSVEAVAAAFVRRFQAEAGLCVTAFFISKANRKLDTIDFNRAGEFSSGNLKILISSDTHVVSEFLISMLWMGLPAIICIVILGPFICLKMGVAGFVAVAASFLTIPFLTVMGKYVTNLETKIKSKEDDLATIIGEWVSNIRLIRYLGWQESFRKKVSGIIRKYTIESMKQHFLYIVCYGISFIWWLVPIALMLMTAQHLKTPIVMEAVFSVIWMLNHTQGFIRFIPSLVLEYSAARACITRLETFIEKPDISRHYLPKYQAPDSLDFRPLGLVLDKVSFAYNGKPVVKEISTRVSLEESTSIIGSVGSGKTTFLKILSGDLKPTSGTIYLELENGIKADLWHENILKQFRSQIGFAAQEAYLSNASIGENISLSDKKNSNDIMESIYFAGLEADIESFEKGIYQEIGENGINLSGGQKQRVNLARGFYSNRKFLFLDDPLSAVDSDTESRLVDGILSHTNCFVLVSHRLLELKRTNRLLVLENGRIVEDGNPVELEKQVESWFSKQLRQDVKNV